jgi:hypothetical protein
MKALESGHHPVAAGLGFGNGGLGLGALGLAVAGAVVVSRRKRDDRA